MALFRVWQDIDVEDVEKHIVLVDDKYGYCPSCKEFGIPLKDLKKCPNCETEFRYFSSNEASQGGDKKMIKRLKEKLPSLQFIDYKDYEHQVNTHKAKNLFNV